MPWTIEGTTDDSWTDTAPLVPEGICIAGLLVPGVAIAGVGYGFWLAEDTSTATVWTE